MVIFHSYGTVYQRVISMKCMDRRYVGASGGFTRENSGIFLGETWEYNGNLGGVRVPPG